MLVLGADCLIVECHSERLSRLSSPIRSEKWGLASSGCSRVFESRSVGEDRGGVGLSDSLSCPVEAVFLVVVCVFVPRKFLWN